MNANSKTNAYESTVNQLIKLTSEISENLNRFLEKKTSKQKCFSHVLQPV